MTTSRNSDKHALIKEMVKLKMISRIKEGLPVDDTTTVKDATADAKTSQDYATAAQWFASIQKIFSQELIQPPDAGKAIRELRENDKDFDKLFSHFNDFRGDLESVVKDLFNYTSSQSGSSTASIRSIKSGDIVAEYIDSIKKNSGKVKQYADSLKKIYVKDTPNAIDEANQTLFDLCDYWDNKVVPQINFSNNSPRAIMDALKEQGVDVEKLSATESNYVFDWFEAGRCIRDINNTIDGYSSKYMSPEQTQMKIGYWNKISSTFDDLYRALDGANSFVEKYS